MREDFEVEMAVEACVVQLLVTGFVHADPHEGNLRPVVLAHPL